MNRLRSDKEHATTAGIGHNGGPPLEDLRCLTVKEWAQLCGFSLMTGKRVLASGEGPKTIQLSARRIGIRVGDCRRWQESRLRDGGRA
jgi:predicted DNA-binding transcriptional regulator AlpA